MKTRINELTYKRLGIDTQHEHFVYMRQDCEVCLSEGFEALTRIRVNNGTKSIVASLNFIRSGLLKQGEISLSESAAKALGIKEGKKITVSHLHPINSLSYIRSKIYGNELSSEQLNEIIKDITEGNYSNIHLSAFITACAGHRMTSNEIIGLTHAMIENGEQIHWNKRIIADKHCIGGLPGNRTSPIIVPIIAAAGLTMPKTSSRAITSPAGTADTMEVMTNVNLPMKQIIKVVKSTGGCIAWGNTAELSPSDDVLIKVEKALNIDSEGQLIASVLSKKVAAGSSHVIIDMPVGDTAKIRSIEAATELKVEIEKGAHELGLKMKVIITDGSQPVGQGIGPALEARDILKVLRNETDGAEDLKERALLLAGELLELCEKADPGEGNKMARKILESGKALEKFMEICKAQGGFVEPALARYQHEIKASAPGVIASIDNRKLARLAKLAGAPDDKASGIDFIVNVGDTVEEGQTLYTIHAETSGELDYALEYYRTQDTIITFEESKNEA